MSSILVIEDEPATQLLLQSHLQDLGYEVVIKSTGAQGIAEASERSYDLFLVDIGLGTGVDGFEVCRRLKRTPQTRGVPVVLLSGQVRESSDLHRGYEAGCESFLIKGDMVLMEDVVRAMLRIKALQDELSAQMRLLEQRNEHLQEALRDNARLEDRLAQTSNRGSSPRFQGGPLPDGTLLVDMEGTVRFADRGSQELFARTLEGKHLGGMAPGTRLEAFVRDARTEARTGFRFSIPARAGRVGHSLGASVIPLVPKTVHKDEGGMKVVLLYDEGRQKTISEMFDAGFDGLRLEERANLLEAAHREFHPSHIVGLCPEMVRIRTRIQALAPLSNPVLLCGEPGVGKRFLARVLHYGSQRTGAFIHFDCSAIERPELEGELFGYDAKSALGRPRSGLVQRAHMGTLFLDGVEKLPKTLQERLLRMLETRQAARIGSEKAESVDVRLVASTTVEVDRAQNAGQFDSDFLGLLRREEILVPPLRERGPDIVVLAQLFMTHCGFIGEEADVMPEVRQALETYEWPSNIHELDTVINRACASAKEGPIGIEHLPHPLNELAVDSGGHVLPHPPPQHAIPGTHSPQSAPSVEYEALKLIEQVFLDLPELAGQEDVPASLEFFEMVALKYALRKTEGDKLAAARLLKVGKSTLYRKLNRYGIK